MTLAICVLVLLAIVLFISSWKRSGDRIRSMIQMYGVDIINSTLGTWQLLDSVRYTAYLSDNTPLLYRLALFDVEYYNLDINVPNPGIAPNNISTTLYVTIKKDYHAKRLSLYNVSFSESGYEVDSTEYQDYFNDLSDLLSYVKNNFIDRLRAYQYSELATNVI